MVNRPSLFDALHPPHPSTPSAHRIIGERTRPRGGVALPVPLPLITDLDGDGRNEVIVLSDGGKTVRVLSVPTASGETLVTTPPPPARPPSFFRPSLNLE